MKGKWTAGEDSKKENARQYPLDAILPYQLGFLFSNFSFQNTTVEAGTQTALQYEEEN